jgi:hypothetical protein
VRCRDNSPPVSYRGRWNWLKWSEAVNRGSFTKRRSEISNRLGKWKVLDMVGDDKQQGE